MTTPPEKISVRVKRYNVIYAFSKNLQIVERPTQKTQKTDKTSAKNRQISERKKTGSQTKNQDNMGIVDKKIRYNKTRIIKKKCTTSAPLRKKFQVIFHKRDATGSNKKYFQFLYII